MLYLLCSVTLQSSNSTRPEEGGYQSVGPSCWIVFKPCETVLVFYPPHHRIITDNMPMEAFIRSWTFQASRVFSSEVSWDLGQYIISQLGDNMKTYQVSMETIGAIDDTIGAEDGDPGYNEPVYSIRPTIRANWCKLPVTGDFLLTSRNWRLIYSSPESRTCNMTRPLYIISFCLCEVRAIQAWRICLHEQY